MAYSVFISYSTRDLTVATNLQEWINYAGATAFLAEYSVIPGTSLAENIIRAIKGCDLFVLLWSHNARGSEWVPQEIGIAKGAGKPIMPVVLHDGLELPGFIKDLKYLALYKDPQAAVDEAYRVLKPNGHFVFTLWFGAEDGNELQKIVKDAIATFATTSITLPEKWTLLRFANKQACEAITRQSGFSTPTFKKLLITFQTASMQQAVDIIDKLSVRANMMIESQPPAMQRQIHAYIVSEIEARRIDGIITLAWPAFLTIVQKPG